MFTLEDSTPGKPLLLHDEPIYFNNKIVGETTSGHYSFNYKKNILFAYIDGSIDLKKNINNLFEIEIAKRKYKINILKKPLHDSDNNFTKI